MGSSIFACPAPSGAFFGWRRTAKRRPFASEGIPVYQAGRCEALGRAGFKPPKAGGVLRRKRRGRDSRGFVPRRCLPDRRRHHRPAAAFAGKVHSAPASAPLPQTALPHSDMVGENIPPLRLAGAFFGQRCAAKRRPFAS